MLRIYGDGKRVKMREDRPPDTKRLSCEQHDSPFAVYYILGELYFNEAPPRALLKS